MSALTEFLFPAPARRTAGAILGWWEKRRLPFNLAVGGAGLVTLGLTSVIAALPPFGSSFFPPWQVVVAFGFMANVCYTLGPAIETLVEKLWGRQVMPIGPALYRMGLTFSVGLALLPSLIVSFLWIIRIIAFVIGAGP